MRIAGRGAAPVLSPLLKSNKKFCNSYVKRDMRLSSASEPAVWCGEGAAGGHFPVGIRFP